jgi:hypothetical protein
LESVITLIGYWSPIEGFYEISMRQLRRPGELQVASARRAMADIVASMRDWSSFSLIPGEIERPSPSMQSAAQSAHIAGVLRRRRGDARQGDSRIRGDRTPPRFAVTAMCPRLARRSAGSVRPVRRRLPSRSNFY